MPNHAQHIFTAPDISVSATQELAIDNNFHRLLNQYHEGDNISAIWTKSIGQPTQLVGITWIKEFQAIVTGKHSEVSGLKHLRGRRLGLPHHPGTAIDHHRVNALKGFLSALNAANIDADEVKFIDFVMHKNIHSLLDAVDRGAIDVAYIKGPDAIKQIRERGLHILFDFSRQPDQRVPMNNSLPYPITADRDLVIQRPDIVARYLATLLRTGDWARKNPKETLQIIARETSSNEADVLAAYGPRLHEQFIPSLDNEYLAALEQQKHFLLQWGFIAKDFDFASWINTEPLQLAKQLIANQPDLPHIFQKAS